MRKEIKKQEIECEHNFLERKGSSETTEMGILISKKINYYCVKCGKQLSFEKMSHWTELEKEIKKYILMGFCMEGVKEKDAVKQVNIIWDLIRPILEKEKQRNWSHAHEYL